MYVRSADQGVEDKMSESDFSVELAACSDDEGSQENLRKAKRAKVDVKSSDSEDDEEASYDDVRLSRIMFGGANLLQKTGQATNPEECLSYRVSTPVMPMKPVYRDFNSFKLIRDHSWWQKNFKRKLQDCSENASGTYRVMKPFLTGDACDEKSSEGLRQWRTQPMDVFNMRPIEHYHLFSSSSLCPMTISGQDFLCYCNLNSIQVKALQEEGLQLNWDQEGYELLNYDMPLDENIFGYSIISEEEKLFLIRQRKAISVIDLEGDIKNTFKRAKEVLSSTKLNFHDELAMVDASGTISTYNTEHGLVWEGENVMKGDLSEFSWATILSSFDGNSLRISCRRAVKLFDLRSSGSKTLYKSLSNRQTPYDDECITASFPSLESQYKWYCSTRDKVMQLDERYPGKLVKKWCHYDNELLLGGSSVVLNGREHVALYTRSGTICFLKEDSSLDYHFAVSDIFNRTPLSPLAHEYLTVPWNGIALFKDKGEGLKVFASDVAGSLYSGKVQICDEENGTDALGEPKEEAAEAEYLREWDDHINQNKFLKCTTVSQISLTSKYQPLEDEDELWPIIKVVTKPRITKKELRKKKNIEKMRRGRKIPSNEECFSEACSHLIPIDPSNHDDDEGIRVLKIFEGEEAFTQFVDDDDEHDSEFIPCSQSSLNY